MENKKVRVSTILLVLLIMLIIGLVVLLSIILVKINSSEKPKNVVINEIKPMENVVNQTNTANTTNTTITPQEKKPADIKEYIFELDSRKKYRVTTDSKMTTVMNDGGTYTNIYYQIDLENNIVQKIEEFHPSKLNKEQKEKKTKTTKKIDNTLSSEITKLFNEIVIRVDSKSEGQYSYFVLESVNREKRIYNKDSIASLRELLKKIDDFKGEELIEND